MKMMKKLKGTFSYKSDEQQQQQQKKKRLLISINVLGSCGPIRLVVNEDEDAAGVIDAALKVYGREGRLPLLGSNVNAFSLYPAAAFAEYDDALKSGEAIGSRGARNFVLCKMEKKKTAGEMMSECDDQKAGSCTSGWRAWLHKSLSLKILSR